jgi:hypothetical protein
MTQPPPNMPTGNRAEQPGQDPEKKALGDLGAPQAIFDTVGGPNLRLRDNLIQLASVIAAILLTFVITLIVSRDLIMAGVVGVIGGAIAGILISGAVLGIYRGIKGVSRMTKK